MFFPGIDINICFWKNSSQQQDLNTSLTCRLLMKILFSAVRCDFPINPAISLDVHPANLLSTYAFLRQGESPAIIRHSIRNMSAAIMELSIEVSYRRFDSAMWHSYSLFTYMRRRWSHKRLRAILKRRWRIVPGLSLWFHSTRRTNTSWVRSSAVGMSCTYFTKNRTNSVLWLRYASAMSEWESFMSVCRFVSLGGIEVLSMDPDSGFGCKIRTQKGGVKFFSGDFHVNQFWGIFWSSNWWLIVI